MADFLFGKGNVVTHKARAIRVGGGHSSELHWLVGEVKDQESFDRGVEKWLGLPDRSPLVEGGEAVRKMQGHFEKSGLPRDWKPSPAVKCSGRGGEALLFNEDTREVAIYRFID